MTLAVHLKIHSVVETIEAELKAGARLNAAPYGAIEPGQVREVEFELVKTSLGGLREVVEALKVDDKVWAVFCEHAEVHTLLEDAQSGSGLRMALEAQVNWMTNDYHHAPCDASWESSHSCACDDECPDCGTSISPEESIEHRLLTETDRGVYTLTGEDLALAADADDQPAGRTPRPGR